MRRTASVATFTGGAAVAIAVLLAGCGSNHVSAPRRLGPKPSHHLSPDGWRHGDRARGPRQWSGSRHQAGHCHRRALGRRRRQWHNSHQHGVPRAEAANRQLRLARHLGHFPADSLATRPVWELRGSVARLLSGLFLGPVGSHRYTLVFRPSGPQTNPEPSCSSTRTQTAGRTLGPRTSATG